MTIAHEEPDRVPVILGTSNTTSIKIKAYRKLKDFLGHEGPDRWIYDWPELGTVIPDEWMLSKLGSDARGVFDAFPAHARERNSKRPAHSPYIDDWGSGASETGPDEWFPDVHPLAEATTIDAIENYAWPDMNDPSRVAHVRAEAKRLHEETDFAVIGTPWLLFPFERAHAMQGLDTFLMNMMAEPEFAQALLDKIASLCETLMDRFLDEAGPFMDIVKIGDDLGTQTSLMISPEMYRSMLKPLHASMIRRIKAKTGAKVFFHTDGDVFDLVPDFIEIGVDILNPIQTSAGKMADLPELKKRYGDKISFCGGIDTQRILPMASPAEVAAEVQRVGSILGKGGGWLLAPVHTIMNEVPPQNIVAMLKAVGIKGLPPV
ncbi:MAG: uroporphyrinogen decarboxylase family protein [Candidatus Paceibacterota bacterium]